jgi:peptide/nickel transport system permease protein
METTSAVAAPEIIDKRALSAEERVYAASQWKLMWLRFRRHRLAMIGFAIVALLYVVTIFHGFMAPYEKATRTEYIYMAPQRVYFHDGERFSLRPFVYGTTVERDLATMSRIFTEDRSVRYYIKWFAPGDPYYFLGIFRTDIHLFGVEEGGTIFLMGTDQLGRDLFSRILYGAAISLSIGLVGVITSFLLGIILGGISGYYGGMTDNIIQRIIEFLISIPTIPLWMGLSAAVPVNWPPERIYFAITFILALTGWTGLARIVRSKLLEVRESDFVMAARLAALRDREIIAQHMLPSTMSYLIVHMTLAIPGMILGETALSFLGLGLQPPVVSWGVLLQQAQNIGAVNTYPWLMWPAVFVVVTVLAFNFMGDGLRDSADPYKN